MNVKKSLVYNVVIFLLVLIGTIFMFTGYQFMTNTTLLDNSGFEAFKYYTVDSNILVGLASFILVIYELLFMGKIIKKIPNYVYVFKYIGVVGVSLTFIVTMFYLAPIFGKNFLFLYMNTNLFFHLIVPILAFISYVKYEKNKLKYKYTFITLSSVILYASYYISNILMHLDKNGNVMKEYDWYSFVVGGVTSIYIVPVIILIITYIISYIIYRLNKKTH